MHKLSGSQNAVLPVSTDFKRTTPSDQPVGMRPSGLVSKNTLFRLTVEDYQQTILKIILLKQTLWELESEKTREGIVKKLEELHERLMSIPYKYGRSNLENKGGEVFKK